MQFVSDLHLDYRPSTISTIAEQLIVNSSNSKYLALLGDISENFTITEKFLRCVISGKWEKIIYILGNHEYYTPSLPQKLFSLNLPKLHILNNQRLELPELTVLGSTLWSNMDSQTTHVSLSKMKITKSQYNNLHQQCFSFLSNEKAKDKPLWIFTHYVPSYRCIHPHFKKFPNNSAYASNCDMLFNKTKVWLFGHSHLTMDVTLDGCRCILNPLGYPSDQNFQFKFNNILNI